MATSLVHSQNMNLETWRALRQFDKELLKKVRLVYIHGYETLLVTDDDEVLACGTNSDRVLGLGDINSHMKPVAIPVLCKKNVRKIIRGGYLGQPFMVVLTQAGEVYTWGYVPERVSVLPEVTLSVHETGYSRLFLEPTLMTSLPQKIKTVACGTLHCLALAMDGELFGWGSNYGTENDPTTSWPIRIQRILCGKVVVKISCGTNFSVAILHNGNVYAWSYGSSSVAYNHRSIPSSELDGYQSGRIPGSMYMPSSNHPALQTPPPTVQKFEGSLVPKLVPQLSKIRMKKIVCGASHILAVSDVHELYVWGRNDKGQLGIGDNDCLSHPPIKNEAIGRVQKVASNFYSNTSAALTEDFKIFVWGECNGFNFYIPTETKFHSLHEAFAHFSETEVTYKQLKPDLDQEWFGEKTKLIFNDEETSDLTIIAENKEIFVHKNVINRSGLFQKLLKDSYDANQKLFIIQENYVMIHAYLRFFYVKKIDPEFALGILCLAHEYQDDDVKIYCVKIIKTHATVDNFASIFSVASRLEEKKLTEFCTSFAERHFGDIIQTRGFLEWDLETTRKFILELGLRGMVLPRP